VGRGALDVLRGAGRKTAPPAQRRGPRPRYSDGELAEHIRRVLGERFFGEGYAIERDELRLDVDRRAARLRRRLGTGRCAARLAGRLAIEQALEDRGLVRRIARGWC
jgi:hypothetical protein